MPPFRGDGFGWLVRLETDAPDVVACWRALDESLAGLRSLRRELRARVNDGVSPVIAGGHDWAAAWALDEQTQRPLYPAVPGGERQRELAFRFGVNLVMYVLTGNYKADQVHLPAIIRRLGQ